jgi:23S rRNA (uracil-5-)-methyltransferase RumA
MTTPLRMVEPRCPYFGTCGGCQNQHVAYEQQLANKRNRLASLLKSHYTGTIGVYHGEPYEYRNRMDFITSHVIGFRQVDPKKLIDVEACPISEPRLNQLLAEVRKWLSTEHLERYDPKRKTGVLKYAVVRVATDTLISFMLNEDSPKLTQHVDAIKRFSERTSAQNVVIAYTPVGADESVSLESFAVKGNDYLTATFCGKTLTFHSQGFFQNNTVVAQQMVERTKELLEQYNLHSHVVVDAYGGVGTFGIVLAPHCKAVISVESYPPGTEHCEQNIRLNNIPNMTAVNEDAGNLRKLDIPADALYVLDPPRSGLGEKMVKYLLERKPRVLVYVSCNPDQLAKELVLLAKHYTVRSADLFDMFPQTNHIEAVVLLERTTQAQ